jgi:hypothetical protein
MAALTVVDLAYLHAQLGTDADEDDLQERYDRLGTTAGVVREVLQQRLADLLVTPAQFAVPGEYTQGTGENIKALQAQLAELGGVDGTASLEVRVLPPPPRRLR